MTSGRRLRVDLIARALWLGLAVALLGTSAGAAETARLGRLDRADFQGEQPSADARRVGNWIVHSHDHGGMPFVVVDKLDSRVFVFDGRGRLRGTAPALMGLAQGDDSVAGIGDRKMSSIRPEERTTPAGRFVASVGRSLNGDEILWVDYDAAIALHRVIGTAPKERRLQRLESRKPQERRITYGCINVPAKFFDEIVLPAFRGGTGIVYVLPETRNSTKEFGSYEVEEQADGPLSR
jgi:hypothetical protein